LDLEVVFITHATIKSLMHWQFMGDPTVCCSVATCTAWLWYVVQALLEKRARRNAHLQDLRFAVSAGGRSHVCN